MPEVGISRIPAVARHCRPGGIPPEDAQAAPVRHRPHHRHDIAQHGALACGGQQVAVDGHRAADDIGEEVIFLGGEGIGRFDHDHVFIVAGGNIIQVELQLRQGAMPEGVVRDADHIEGHLPAGDVIEPPARHVVVTALGDVQHDQRRLVAVLHRPVALFEQVSQVVEVVVIAVRPQHAGVDLVAHLHHVRGRALGDQAAAHLVGVVVDSAV